jgi:hypothetical protein
MDGVQSWHLSKCQTCHPLPPAMQVTLYTANTGKYLHFICKQLLRLQGAFLIHIPAMMLCSCQPNDWAPLNSNQGRHRFARRAD